jgi:hypothetical protein
LTNFGHLGGGGEEGGVRHSQMQPACQIWLVLPSQKNCTTINRWVVGHGRSRQGDGKVAPFCGRINLTKMTFGGVVSRKQMDTGRPNLSGPPSITSQTHHNQPRRGWALSESARGWRSGCILFRGIYTRKCWWGLKTHLNCSQAAKFDHPVWLLASIKGQ